MIILNDNLPLFHTIGGDIALAIAVLHSLFNSYDDSLVITSLDQSHFTVKPSRCEWISIYRCERMLSGNFVGLEEANGLWRFERSDGR